jgi:hypothetical protein
VTLAHKVFAHTIHNLTTYLNVAFGALTLKRTVTINCKANQVPRQLFYPASLYNSQLYPLASAWT